MSTRPKRAKLTLAASSDELGAGGSRTMTFSARIVAKVREAVFEGRMKPGDFLASEKELAAEFGVSRMVARDALRTLEAMGVVDIKVGAGGGARIAYGNTQRFSEALSIQLALTGARAGEVMEVQRALEPLAAGLAARNATDADIARLRALLDEGRARMGEAEAYTRLCMAFHLAVADMSGNRVIGIQLQSLRHVVWPDRNRTLTDDVAQAIMDRHEAIFARIAAHDPQGARAAMERHLGIVARRRMSEYGETDGGGQGCC